MSRYPQSQQQMTRLPSVQPQQVPESEDYNGHGRRKFGWRRHRGYRHPDDYYHDHRRRGIPLPRVVWRDGVEQQQSNYGGEYDDDVYENSYNGFDDDEYYGEEVPQKSLGAPLKNNMPLGNKQLVTQPMKDHFADMTDAELKMPANIATKSVVFEASREYTPAQFFDQSGKLKADGKLIFSASKKHLVPIHATCQSDVFNVAPSDHREDLVSEIELKIWSNYNKKLVVSIPTIGALDDEHFRGGADHVNFTIPANTLNPDTPHVITYKRNITNGTIAFANVYDSPSPDTMESGIAHVKGRGISYVPWKHAIVHYYNMDHANDGLAISEETLDPAYNGDVVMATSDVEKYLARAKQSVSKVVSLGNVTNGPQIVIEACEPQDRINMASRIAEVGGDIAAIPRFEGLADARYFYGKSYNDEKRNSYMNKLFNFDMEATFKYVKLGKGPIKPAK